jgi:hypothetical protein
MSSDNMLGPTHEINRRALVADFGATLAEQPEFRDHVDLVQETMPLGLAWAIERRHWIVEPAGGDIALALAGVYGSGRRRRRIIAIFIRAAAAAKLLAPHGHGVGDPWGWAEISLMNVGAIAHTPTAESAGPRRRPSGAALDCRDRGCRGIALRGAGRCVVCGSRLPSAPVSGAVIDRAYRPMTCASHSSEDERHVTDAMHRVFGRFEWLLAGAMTLRVELLAAPRLAA